MTRSGLFGNCSAVVRERSQDANAANVEAVGFLVVDHAKFCVI
jgi:hypothetical protein